MDNKNLEAFLKTYTRIIIGSLKKTIECQTQSGATSGSCWCSFSKLLVFVINPCGNRFE